MFELRRLTKTVKRYVYFFQNEPEEFRENVDLYINDLKKLISYTDSYILSTQDELNNLYKANIDLYTLNPAFILRPLVFIIMKIVEKMMDTRSKELSTIRRYHKYFKNFLERLERMKYLCDL